MPRWRRTSVARAPRQTSFGWRCFMVSTGWRNAFGQSAEGEVSLCEAQKVPWCGKEYPVHRLEWPKREVACCAPDLGPPCGACDPDEVCATVSTEGEAHG